MYNHRSTTSESKAKEDEEAASKLTEEDVGNIFNYYDKNGDGSISVKELIEVFKQLGVDISDTNKVDKIMTALDVDNDGIVTKENFINWWFSSSAILEEFDSAVRSLLFLYGMNFVGQRSDELHAFAQYLNRIFTDNDNNNMTQNVSINGYFPIDPADGGHDILSKLVDGVLLAKMINIAVPNTIDERVIHYRDIKSDTILPKQIVENLNIVLSSCKAIGVSFGKTIENGSISVEKFLDPSHYEDIIREILSELSKIHLSKQINLKDNPVLIRLAAVYEDDEMIKSLTSEDWLKRWINYQLKRSGEDIKIKNFGKDFRDGAVLSHILHSVTKRKKKKVERFDVNKAFQQPTYARPGYILKVLQQQFNLTVFLSANDILSGNSRLIKLLCAQIFSKFKGMRKITKQEIQQVNDIYADDENDVNNTSTKPEITQTQVFIINKYSSSTNINNKSSIKKNKNAVKFADENDPKLKHKKNNKYKKGQWDVHNGRKRNGSRNKKGNNNNNNDDNEEKKTTDNDNDTENKQSEDEDIVQREIREERDIVNWMNEIFSASNLYDQRIKDSKVILKINNVTRDLKDGLVLLYFMNLMEPKCVDWNNVNTHNTDNDDSKNLTRLQCLGNCHYIISLIKKEPFSTSFFNIESFPSDGNDIYNGNKDLIFKICHNLINYHYVVTLTQLLTFKATEFDILHWTNEQLKKKLKYPRFCSFEEKKLHQFNDTSLKSCLYYIDLLLMLMDDPRNDINRDIVIHKNNRQFPDDDYTKSECLSNARYALSIARKFGGVFYISEHDLVNVTSPEITMSFVMCIMVLILTKQQKDKENGKLKKSKSTSKHNKNKGNDDHKEDEIIDALQIHLDQQNELASNAGSLSQQTSTNTMNDDDLEKKQNIEHGRKRSVLQDYGIITDNDQLQELRQISRQYSSPNMVTPTPKQQTD